MPRVVFDTNVYISAFITRNGKAEEAYFLAVEGVVEGFTSVPILSEIGRKLREKFSWDDHKIIAALRHISKSITVIKPDTRLRILKDEPDNRILECAQKSEADFIVTGDKHLLRLQAFEGIKILTINELLLRLKKA